MTSNYGSKNLTAFLTGLGEQPVS